MKCKICGFEKHEHIGDDLLCIGNQGTFHAYIENATAEVLYTNENGVGAREGSYPIIRNGRSMSRVENVIERLLRLGYTDISINITAE